MKEKISRKAAKVKTKTNRRWTRIYANKRRFLLDGDLRDLCATEVAHRSISRRILGSDLGKLFDISVTGG
jgi:hypothetical protein